MKTVIYFAVSFLVGGLLVYLFCFWKKYKTQKEIEQRKKETDELIEACEKADIDKLIMLLEKGMDPNTRVQLMDTSCHYDGHLMFEHSFYVTKTLLDISWRSEAVKKLLRAYGAKTIAEINKEEAAIQKVLDDAEKAEEERRNAIRQAEKKAKDEEDLRKVEAFLAS